MAVLSPDITQPFLSSLGCTFLKRLCPARVLERARRVQRWSRADGIPCCRAREAGLADPVPSGLGETGCKHSFAVGKLRGWLPWGEERWQRASRE